VEANAERYEGEWAMRSCTWVVCAKYLKSLKTGMKRLDLKGNESTSMVPMEAVEIEGEDAMPPIPVEALEYPVAETPGDRVPVEPGYTIRFSTIRFVKKLVMIASNRWTRR